MKTNLSLFLLTLVALTSCSTPSAHDKSAAGSPPETVLVTYRVKPGQETEFQDLLTRLWKIYQENHLVFEKPHILVRDTEDGNKPRFVEVFTWVSHDAPEHAPAAVTAIWQQEQSLVESRNGHGGLEGGEVDLLVSKEKKR